MLYKKDQAALPAFIISCLVTLGTYLGFTFLKHKAPWYIGIHYVGSSILSGLTLYYLVSEKVFQKYYIKFCLTFILPLLFLSASFPSIFTHYERPFEVFLEKASSSLSQDSIAKLDGKSIADCIDIVRTA